MDLQSWGWPGSAMAASSRLEITQFLPVEWTSRVRTSPIIAQQGTQEENVRSGQQQSVATVAPCLLMAGSKERVADYIQCCSPRRTTPSGPDAKGLGCNDADHLGGLGQVVIGFRLPVNSERSDRLHPDIPQVFRKKSRALSFRAETGGQDGPKAPVEPSSLPIEIAEDKTSSGPHSGNDFESLDDYRDQADGFFAANVMGGSEKWLASRESVRG